MTTETPRDYRDTIFLPKTEFADRGQLAKREPDFIARWDEMQLYKRMREARAGAKPWLLHDGPPYANGHIHLGTAMNKILKDICVRSHRMMGFDASYLPGWDCHGLPIEWKVEEEFRSKGRTKDDVGGAEFRARCRSYAAEWVEVQKQEFRALGIEGEWDDPYLTMAFESEAAIVGEFLDVAMSGRLVRGAKPVMWSPVERTALAEAEVEYHDRKVPVIWVKFPVVPMIAQHDNLEVDAEILNDLKGSSVVIWTTTPWTIPANQAVSYNPRLDYALYRVNGVMSEEDLGFAPYALPGNKLILCVNRVEEVMEASKVISFTKVRDVDPNILASVRHPFGNADWADNFWGTQSYMLPGDHVTDDAGTGFVHTAPAHGEDDFVVWLTKRGSHIRQIVDADGCYTDEVPERFRGLDIVRTSGKKRGQAGKANDEVIKALAESGNLLARGMTTIRDAHSWRSKAPVIRRATPQWFIAMDQSGSDSTPPLRQLVMDALKEVRFFPATGRNRLEAMVADRPDWLVSRQRNWGVPLTIFVNGEGKPHTAALPREQAEAINAKIKAAIAAEGVEAWFREDHDAAHFFEGTGADPSDWDKVEDVLDVWFDSGTTHAFALRARGIIDEREGQADLYLEGSDQHRGWFQSSLLECCATRGIAPYRQVLTHGFIVDANGKKMSKSLGNTVEPEQIQKQYGIEILRIWAASADFTEDLRISTEILKRTSDTYRRLRNTLKYLLGATAGFSSQAEALPPEDMPSLERWVLHRLAELDTLVRDAYGDYDFKKIMAALVNFCAVDLSAVYFDIRKDSLYCDPVCETADYWDADTAVFGNRRRAARTVMNAVLERLMVWLAPIMPFTTEDAFWKSGFDGESVHLQKFPDSPDAWSDPALAARWDQIFAVRRVVTGALEVQRRDKVIGSSLEAAPQVYVADPSMLAAFDGQDAAEIFITSGASLTLGPAPAGAFRLEEVDGVGVVFARARGVKCARSWKYFDADTADPSYAGITPRDALSVRALDAASR
ncbi:MAG: isoleucine--tRNA ligase [Pseudomonadota bacterium]